MKGMRMNLEKLLKGIDYSVGEDFSADIEAGKICCDSRNVQPGDVFF